MKKQLRLTTFVFLNWLAASGGMYLYNLFLFRRFGTSTLRVSISVFRAMLFASFALGFYLEKENARWRSHWSTTFEDSYIEYYFQSCEYDAR